MKGADVVKLPETNGGWQVVYADPAWRFASNSKANPGRNAMRHYECMTVEEIAAMPVSKVVADDALLLMWVTVPFSHRAYEVVDAWGFKPKSQLVWVKSRIATGYWARNQHEICIIARRGKFPCLRPALFPTSLIPGETREHSRKPEWVQDQVDMRFPLASKLELNARRERVGWTVWGNETTKFEGMA